MATFSVFSEHGRALVLIARNARVPIRKLAETLGVSERNAQRIVGDLIGAGFVTRTREGRRAILTMAPEVRAGVLAVDAVDVQPASQSDHTPSRKDAIFNRLLAVTDDILSGQELFANVSVERLIKAAGISRSTFYANFQDKDDLLIALVNNLMEALRLAAKTWTDLGPELCKDDIVSAMHQVADARHPHRLIMTAASQSEATKVKAHYRTLMTQSAEMVREHILRGQAEGFVRKDIDPATTALLLTWGTEHRLNVLAITDRQDEKVQQALGSLADVIWNILYAGVRQ